MTAAGVILRPVSFILDPVPRVDRPRSRGHAVHDAIADAVVRAYANPNPFDLVSWFGFIQARIDNPTASPARLRPYDWAIEHAWPVDGWGLS